MRCFDCGKTGEKIYEFVDGRKTIYLCAMCKAEREIRETAPENIRPPSPSSSFFSSLTSSPRPSFSLDSLLSSLSRWWQGILNFFKKR